MWLKTIKHLWAAERQSVRHIVSIFFPNANKRLLSINFHLINCSRPCSTFRPFTPLQNSSTENFSFFRLLLSSVSVKLGTPARCSLTTAEKFIKKLRKIFLWSFNRIQTMQSRLLSHVSELSGVRCIKSFPTNDERHWGEHCDELWEAFRLNGEKQKRKLNYFMTKESCLLSLYATLS